MIIEGLLTTIGPNRAVNVAPMGPLIDADRRTLTLRPFQGSTSLANLKRTGQGVFHLVDDVELLAQAAIDALEPPPSMHPATAVDGWILDAACRWLALRVVSIDESQPRVEIRAEIVASGDARPWSGFNRARHAVLEAAILATRVRLLPADEILAELARWEPLVRKTGGVAERRAWQLLVAHVRGALGLDATLQSLAGAKLVEVTTGSRLHFGMFSFGQPQVPAFGGVGAMIDRPGFKLVVEPAERLEVDGPLAPAVLQTATRAQSAGWLRDLPGCRIRVLQTARQHVGLGTGTQLALAIAAGVNALAQGPIRTADDLSQVTGRAGRSSIGTYGFLRGGMLVESGHPAESATGGVPPSHAVGDLVARVAVPEAWRWVLVTPRAEQGLWGPAERQAFEQLPAVDVPVTDALCRLALLELLPSAQRADFAAFSGAVYEFGRRAGECFASAQQGLPFHPWVVPRIAWLADRLSCHGIQSSWGPSIAVIVSSADEASSLVDRLSAERLFAEADLQTAAPLNRGAGVSITGGGL